MNYKNFKTVMYCVAQWVDNVTENQLKEDIAFFKKYCPVDKIYLETFRGGWARKEKVEMVKRICEENGIEVSGGITTVTPNLDEEDSKRQRLFETFCFSNEKMRDELKKVSEYTASFFDEYIIDDFFFTQCMCEDCQKEKGDKTWSQFRLEKMMDVSKNLILGPAKKVNPNCKVIIKYPNWRESYHETGYNPKEQRKIFDAIYTGTETRHGAQQDQHLPRYLSYSLPRYMENVLPGKNGGGWFDPFECDRIDTYLEQMYLTAFSKCKEIMFFCWPALTNNKRITPAGFQLKKIDNILGKTGTPKGLSVYIPFDSYGEDHLEDFLGMIGIPFEPTPDFKEDEPAILLLQSALFDKDIVKKLKAYVNKGGKAIVTSGFMTGALEKYPEISELTGISYSGKTLDADEFQVTVSGLYGRNYVKSAYPVSFPLLEHRNNASWSILNAGHGEYHESLIMYDTYGKGKFEVLTLPFMPSRIKDLPQEVMNVIRQELIGDQKIWIDAPYGVSLFTYDNKTFGLYCYTNDGCAPIDFDVHIQDDINEIVPIPQDDKPNPWQSRPIPAKYKADLYPSYMKRKEKESVFHLRMIPGDFIFFEEK